MFASDSMCMSVCCVVKALTRSAKHDGKKDWIDRQLKELEERELERRKAESIEIRLPDHPQPATITNKSVVVTHSTESNQNKLQALFQFLSTRQFFSKNPHNFAI